MKKEKLMTFCDMVFVLVLCFVILLATMLLTSGGAGAQPGQYVVSLPRLAATAGAILFYLFFMLKLSLKSLKDMTKAWEENAAQEDGTESGAEIITLATQEINEEEVTA